MLCAVVKAQGNCSKKKEDTVPADHPPSGATQKMDLMLLDEERGGVLCFIVLKEDTGAISAVSFFPCRMNWEQLHRSCPSLSSPGLLFSSKQCRWKCHQTQDLSLYAMHKRVMLEEGGPACHLPAFLRTQGGGIADGLRNRLQSCLWAQKGTCQRWGTIAVWNSSKVQLLSCIKTGPFLHLKAVFLEKSSIQKPTQRHHAHPARAPDTTLLHLGFSLQWQLWPHIFSSGTCAITWWNQNKSHQKQQHSQIGRSHGRAMKWELVLQLKWSWKHHGITCPGPGPHPMLLLTLQCPKRFKRTGAQASLMDLGNQNEWFQVQDWDRRSPCHC